VDGFTVREAAATTGWSPRMLRYIEESSLVVPPRSASGYRLYRAIELRRLSELRELLTRFEISLDDVGFALRMRSDPELRLALDAWLRAAPANIDRIRPTDWLGWEQEKHQRLLSVA
jgi:DNA-binding transcriptional MerR regulator